MQTKRSNYEPTTAEQRLLETLLNPESIGKPVTVICGMADIDRSTYYRAMEKDEFVELTKGLAVKAVMGKVSHVVNATYENALTDRGYQDRKMILTMAGIYSDKVELEAKDLNLSIKVDYGTNDKE